jgi:hypothetical protein
MNGSAMPGACDCGACAGVGQSTPLLVENRPGLPAIAVRIGTYRSFLRSMLAGLSDPDRPALAALRVRTSDDFSIAVLDAFAIVADILTFYQERFAQENYLRPATELRSILQLARLIGYELNPGAAAETPLAFTLDSSAGSPTTLDLPVGTQAQSTPGPGEEAQLFETVEAVTATRQASALKPRLTRAAIPRAGDAEIWLEGAALNLKPGDPLVFVGAEKLADPTSPRWDFRRIATVAADPQRGFTHVVLDEAIADQPGEHPAQMPRVFALRRQVSLFGYNAQPWAALPVSQRIGDVDPTSTKAPPGNVVAGIYANRRNSWNNAPLSVETTRIDLDAVYSQITIDSWIVLAKPGSGRRPAAQLYRVTGTADTNAADFGLTARVTQLGISGNHIEWFSPADAAVYAQSEALALAERPIVEPLDLGTIELDGYVPGLAAGRSLIVAGRRARVAAAAGSALQLAAADGTSRALATGEQLIVIGLGAAAASGMRVYTLETLDGFAGTVAATRAELPWTAAMASDPVLADATRIADVRVSADAAHSIIDLSSALTHFYDRASVTIYANVANATAGQTVQELLGGGDGSTPFQSFRLKQPPLTFTAAPTPRGVQSTLQVTCNDLPWTLVDTLYGQGALAQIFTERNDENANTDVLFGDGVRYGARPPSGIANIKAKYRKGLGHAGNVDAGQIDTLLSRPLGLKSVTNPLPATGGADPQPPEAARARAPLSVATLGRAVSILDYQNFALGFAGIAKALASWTWDGAQRRVVLTVAGIDGAAVDPGSRLAGNLVAALADFGDATVPVRLQSYRPVTFRLGIDILPADPTALAATQKAVEAALRAAFGFAARSFGQWVSLSEVLEVAQGVTGVVAVQITQLYRSDGPPGLDPILVAAAAPAGGEGALPAELLTLDPGPLAQLGAMG